MIWQAYMGDLEFWLSRGVARVELWEAVTCDLWREKDGLSYVAVGDVHERDGLMIVVVAVWPDVDHRKSGASHLTRGTADGWVEVWVARSSEMIIPVQLDDDDPADFPVIGMVS